MDPAAGPARTIPFLTPALAAEVRARFGTPCYVYDRATLEAAARRALAFPAPFGFTLRYAMKANPSAGVLGVFRDLGLHVDASSDFEVERALRAGFAPGAVQLTSQMPSRRLRDHVERGVLFNACSLHQLEEFGRLAAGRDVAVRMNPGLGSGSTKRTNTGGPGGELRHLARVPRRGQGRRRPARGAHPHPAQPYRLGHRARGVEARHPHDARPGRAAPRRRHRQPRRRVQGGPHAGGAVHRPRRRGRARAPAAVRVPGAARAGPSGSRSSQGRFWSR